ncbi:hypothetical protein BD779DRAFT_226572 [Infundibulicybe gibba]|nr:hypothetical protein BD779DRAFT_226572 [Infundibulicybe gibba]
MNSPPLVWLGQGLIGFALLDVNYLALPLDTMPASNLHRHTLVKTENTPQVNTQDPQATKDTPTKSTHPPRISTYPPAPPEKYADHLLFYGFYCDEQWLVEYTHHNSTSILDESMSTSMKELASMRWFINLLRRKTGLRTLEYEGVVVDGDTPPNAVILESERPRGPKYHMILSICGWDKRSWRRRPTLEQVETVSKIMGSQPRWWIDIELPIFYQ